MPCLACRHRPARATGYAHHRVIQRTLAAGDGAPPDLDRRQRQRGDEPRARPPHATELPYDDHVSRGHDPRRLRPDPVDPCRSLPAGVVPAIPEELKILGRGSYTEEMSDDPSGRVADHQHVQERMRFLDCGLLEHGFARVRCGTCRAEFLVVFRCKGRQFCPSCHARRLAEWSVWLDEHLLAPVAHRRVLLTVPKRLRKLPRQVDRSKLDSRGARAAGAQTARPRHRGRAGSAEGPAVSRVLRMFESWCAA